MAWGNRKRTTAVANLGWICGLFGGLLMTYSQAGGVFSYLGHGLLTGGLVAVFFFTSHRPIVRRPMDYLWRVLDGLKAVSGVMGMFGDVLSYMRLFALGLASASLALTFNGLAVQIQEAVPGLGLLLALLVLLLGHAINLGLALMSGVVHGLRLNFIEFYKWGMPGEGKAFQRFARKEVRP